LEVVDRDVAGVLAGPELDAPEVREDRRALVLVVLALDLERVAEQRVAAARVDAIARADRQRIASGVLRLGLHLADAVDLELADLDAFARIDAVLARVQEQHLVELLALDLERVRRRRAECAPEMEGLVAALARRLKIGAVLDDAERSHLFEHTELLQDRKV